MLAPRALGGKLPLFTELSIIHRIAAKGSSWKLSSCPVLCSHDFQRRRRSRCVYGYDSLRCSTCLRHPYGVKPCGLYTDSVVATSNSSRPTPA